MSSDEHLEEHHVVGYGTFVGIWVALLVLTALTVAAAGLDLGPLRFQMNFDFSHFKGSATLLSLNLNIAVALLIATFKTSLVMMFFMHLRYESKLFAFLVLVAIVTLGIILILTFTDYPFR